jgi:type II restriction enzyme
LVHTRNGSVLDIGTWGIPADSITDGAYAAMMNAIRHDETPNFYFMQYELATWRVKNLLLVPSFAFPPSAIIKRKPLSSTARRAGWVGCNFALNRIPGSARIPVVNEGAISPPSQVRERYRLARKQVEGLTVKQREKGSVLTFDIF